MSLTDAGPEATRTDLSTAVIADGNLFPNLTNGAANVVGGVVTDGWKTLLLELQKTNTGTCSVQPQGSYDGGTTWYTLGYQQIDNTASPARAVAAFALGASNPTNHVLQILDLAPLMRFVVSSSAGTYSLTARLYKVP